MKVYKVERYMACATSAMREAYNGNDVVDVVYSQSNIKIDIIDGKKKQQSLQPLICINSLKRMKIICTLMWEVEVLNFPYFQMEN